jgi:hypothetical protein
MLSFPTTRKGSGQSTAERGKHRDSDERSEGGHKGSEEEPGRDNYWGVGEEVRSSFSLHLSLPLSTADLLS